MPARTKGIQCPACGGVTDVVDSRPYGKPGATIRRRRECLAECGASRFTTIEVSVPEPVIGVGMPWVRAAMLLEALPSDRRDLVLKVIEAFGEKGDG